MPGAVPRTSTLALTNVTTPYAVLLANNGPVGAVKANAALAKGVNIYKGKITYEGVAKGHNLPFTPLSDLI